MSSSAFAQAASAAAMSRLMILRLPGEALAHRVPDDLRAEGGKSLLLAGVPRALDELHDADPAAVAEHTQRQAEGGRRLALPGPGVDDEQAFFIDRLAGNLGILNGLALRHLGAVALFLFLVDRLHHFTCIGRPATMKNTRPASAAIRWLRRP